MCASVALATAVTVTFEYACVPFCRCWCVLGEHLSGCAQIPRQRFSQTPARILTHIHVHVCVLARTFIDNSTISVGLTPYSIACLHTLDCPLTYTYAYMNTCQNAETSACACVCLCTPACRQLSLGVTCHRARPQSQLTQTNLMNPCVFHPLYTALLHLPHSRFVFFTDFASFV